MKGVGKKEYENVVACRTKWPKKDKKIYACWILPPFGGYGTAGSTLIFEESHTIKQAHAKDSSSKKHGLKFTCHKSRLASNSNNLKLHRLLEK
jgi:hypothetical protein